MKKLHFILFCFLSLNTSLFAQWIYQNSGTTSWLTSVKFPAKDTGYAVGYVYGSSAGTILKTTDGGNNWALLNINGGALSDPCIYFTSAKIGYVAGGDSVYKTTDGGYNWIATNINGSSHLHAICFPVTDTGYAVDGGTIVNNVYKTTNGGNSWVVQTTSYSNVPFCVFFTSSDTGYVGGSNFILKTINGGNTWVKQTTGPGIGSITFTSTDTGYAVGASGLILKTTNGGTNWVHQTSGTGNNLFSIFFTTKDTGYISEQVGSILKTTNGGATWTPQIIDTVGNNLYSIYFTDVNTGYAVGMYGVILKTTDGGITYINAQMSKNDELNIFPNPAQNKLEITVDNEQIKEVKLYDVLGKEVLSTKEKEIDVSSLNESVYFLHVKTSGNYYTKKVVITH